MAGAVKHGSLLSESRWNVWLCWWFVQGYN